MCFSDLGSLAQLVFAVRTDANSVHPVGSEHTDVLGGHERVTVATVGHSYTTLLLFSHVTRAWGWSIVPPGRFRGFSLTQRLAEDACARWPKDSGSAISSPSSLRSACSV